MRRKRKRRKDGLIRPEEVSLRLIKTVRSLEKFKHHPNETNKNALDSISQLDWPNQQQQKPTMKKYVAQKRVKLCSRIINSLLIVILSSIALHFALCDPQQPPSPGGHLKQLKAKSTKASAVAAAASEKKSTVMKQPVVGDDQSSTDKQSQLHENQFEVGGTGSWSSVVDIEQVNRLVVRKGESAVLGCHVLGKPLELSAVTSPNNTHRRSKSRWTTGKQDANWNKTSNHYDGGEKFMSSGSLTGMVSGLDSEHQFVLNEYDLVSLVFWYKDDDPTPIYTLDARQVDPTLLSNTAAAETSTTLNTTSNIRKLHYHRNKGEEEGGGGGNPLVEESGGNQLIRNNRKLLANAKHYPSNFYSSTTASDGSATTRLKLDISSQFPIIKLVISQTEGQDSGQYKCRVDFRRSRTITQVVALLVEVPISRLEISIGHPKNTATVATNNANEDRNESEEPNSGGSLSENDETAVFKENQEVQFTCLALDASPAPTISWLVRWPNFSTNETSGSSTAERPPTEQLLTSTTLNRYGAVLQQEEMSREQCLEWLMEREATTTTTMMATEQLVYGSRLTIKPLTRPLHGLMIGCRASQQVTLAYISSNYRSSSTTGPHGPGETQDAAKKVGVGGGNIRMIDASSSNVTNEQQQLVSNTNGLPAAAQQNFQLTKWFELKLRLGPQHIEILSEHPVVAAEGLPAQNWIAELDEGQEVKFLCSSRGSQPAASISWSLWAADEDPPAAAGGFRTSSGDVRGASRMRLLPKMPEASIVGSTAGTGTSASGSSLFELSPVTRRHHMVKLVCTATNELLAPDREDRSLTAQIKLLVRFKPTVKLVEISTSTNEPFGARELAKKVKSVYKPTKLNSRRLKCSVQSNPPINQLVWLVNEKPIARVTRITSTEDQPKPPQPTSSSSSIGAAIVTAASAPSASVKRSGPKVAQKSSSVSAHSHSSIAKETTTTTTTNDTEENFEEDEEDEEGESFGGKATSSNFDDGELLNWSLSPLISEAIDESKYLIEGNLLTVMNLTKLDQKDEYKCLAISSIGQVSSQKFRFSVNYKPLCLSKHNQQQQQGLDSTLGLGLETDQVWQIGSSETGSVRCQVEAEPAPIKFAWSFVSLNELVKMASTTTTLADKLPDRVDEPVAHDEDDAADDADAQSKQVLSQLNQSASLQMETDGAHLSYSDLFTWTSAVAGGSGGGEQKIAAKGQQHGLLLCRALNQVGWQVKPCVNLILTSELLEPSAGNCSVEPLVEGRFEGEASNSSSSFDGQQQRKHIAISVDCSRTPNKEQLLFQLAISRRDTTPPPSSSSSSSSGISNSDQWRERTTAAGVTTNNWRNKRLLFTESAYSDGGGDGKITGQSTRIPISALLADLDVALEEPPAFASQAPKDSTQQPEMGAQSDQSSESGGSSRNNAQQRKLRRGPMQQPSKIMTLSEQIELLNELVFSISASNLLRTSESHAILGSELRIPEVNLREQQEERPPAAAAAATGAAQVSRSASHADSLTDTESQTAPSSVTIAATNHHLNNALQHNKRNGNAAPPGRLQTNSDQWSSHLEANITLVAIGSTVILSALTLTLIILILRARSIESTNSSCGSVNNYNKVTWFNKRRRSESKRDNYNEVELPLNNRPPGTPSKWQQVTSDARQGASLDFLAPPVRSSLKRSSANGGKSMVLTMTDGSICAPAQARHLSLSPCLQQDESQTPEQQTLYVISTARASSAMDGGGEFELASNHDQEPSQVSYTTDEPCASVVSHLYGTEPVDHLLAGQQLLSYCSPSLCNSSSHHESLATTNNTSSDHQFVTVTQPASGSSGLMATSSLAINCHHRSITNMSPATIECNHHTHNQIQQQQQQQIESLMELQDHRELVEMDSRSTTTTSGKVVCATNNTSGTMCSDSMYLFSFL